MHQAIVRCLVGVLLGLIVVFFVPPFITAQEEGPPIPHKLERRGDCLGCHAEGKFKSPKVPDDPTHVESTNEVCQDCHRQVTPATIPHTLEDREDCLKCHVIAEEGATPADETVTEDVTVSDEETLPAAETVSEEETASEDETAPADETVPSPPPTAELIPTPIAYPKVKGVNTCLDCHLTLEDDTQIDITSHWQRSIHAERDVACVDCHGGDSSAATQDEAKTSAAGYIGIPAKADIPALCAGCHADVVKMRQYDLPTDQYAKYQESIHGIRLTEGDTNVATCFDCHGGHLTLKANDPASSVYPANVPVMCADCHADQELMAPYEIPTNQFSLYQQSVHGHALLDNQDFRAPNCATCHGTHGAAPPGFEEVANVCGSCHSATQDHYLQSPHAGGDELSPKCVDCHGRYDVSKPSEALYLGAEARHCGECHSADSEPGRVAQALYDNIASAAGAYDEAEAAIQIAREVGMLVAPMEGRLREATTDLVTARAAQHTLDLDTVNLRTDSVLTITTEVKASAEAAVAQSIFRRRAMVIAVAAIGLTIVALIMLKRELDRRLAEDES
jgi:nitrate/TMAO reductase-like tetraheme cytochrome c subunit